MTTKSREERIQDLLDKQDILEALTRFSRGLDRFDRELFLSAFWDDAEIVAGPYAGSAAGCWDWAVPLHEAGQSATQHGLLNVTYDIAGDTAHVETYYLFVGRNRDDTTWLAGGRYVDRFARRGGNWRIALRTNAIEWSTMLPSMFIPSPTPRNHHDISYRRPLTNRSAPSNPSA
jgi:hypothetical protein